MGSPDFLFEWSSWATSGFADYFTYTHEQADWLKSSQWLEAFMTSDAFTVVEPATWPFINDWP
ncbi:hypothetical protein [Spirosoma utsteinense]|uniref:Uncharacterized protein n=1 Tax=Spirosoma utsteinense TaxID=2585773 RepID=A0ABR6WEP5_9BACT|nr:hypothetical protein [Spirosoma utsteinense]MBC3794764.1 hypothetical protein [Spirosoma utsteinense]